MVADVDVTGVAWRRLCKVGLLTLMFMGLAGCATRANYEKILNTWVGKPVDKLVLSWGPPNSSYKLTDGRTIIEYASSRTVTTGGNSVTRPETSYHYDIGSRSTVATTAYVTETTPVYTDEYTCKTRFIIGTDGKIASGTAKGNDCVARGD
jgi:hypothetical protein